MPEETKRKISLAQKGKPKGVQTRLKMSEAAKRRCQNPEYRKELSRRIKQQWTNPQNRERFLAATRNKRMSAASRSLISVASKRLWQRPGYAERMLELNRATPRSETWRRNLSEAQQGSKGNNWQGGKTAANKIIHHSVEWKLWREAVFKRDNWTCVFCGMRGKELHPDHIKPFASYPALRFCVENGRTLCAPCHRKTDTYGRGGKTQATC